jgi:predicted phosphodiesterase
MNRLKFIKTASAVAILLANGKWLYGNDMKLGEWEKRKVKLRFVVASDGHYGEPNTAYETYFDTLVKRINEEHAKKEFEFCVINGDIIHNDKKYFTPAKAALDELQVKYYVSQGNHDHVNAAEWESVWSMPVNHDFVIGKNTFLILTTVDEKGTYLCPDLDWLKARLKAHEQQQNIFIFMHINPAKLTANAIDCEPLFDLLAKQKNVRAIFNGHDHDEEGVKTKNNIPFLFSAHFGGSWGTSYRGFRVVELLKDNSVATYMMNPVESLGAVVI